MQAENIHTAFEDSYYCHWWYPEAQCVPKGTGEFSKSTSSTHHLPCFRLVAGYVVNFILPYFLISCALLIQKIIFCHKYSFSSITDHPLYQTERSLPMWGNLLAWLENFQRMANPK
jgi:hypothetical protein